MHSQKFDFDAMSVQCLLFSPFWLVGPSQLDSDGSPSGGARTSLLLSRFDGPTADGFAETRALHLAPGLRMENDVTFGVRRGKGKNSLPQKSFSKSYRVIQLKREM